MENANGSRSLKLWMKNHPRTVVLIIIGLAVIGAIIAGIAVFGGDSSDTNTNTTTTNSSRNTTSEGKKATRKIDGAAIESGRENFFPVALMVENLVASRPQSGLDHANLVYEVLVEGGITRFMAVYASGDQIEKIGPVRSARTYYLDWAKELGALYGHIGGSPEALQLIPQYEVIDLNQFYNSQYYWREKTRPAPHNLYTSSELLSRAVRDKNLPETGDYTSWDYSLKDQGAATAKKVTIDFSNFNYQVEYRYAQDKNQYERYLAGQPHTMDNGTAITAKNVIVQFVKTRLAGEGRLNIETIGEGEARIYRNGEEVLGTWKKTARDERTMYYDASGDAISFVPGTTWVAVVPTDRTVTYQ